MDLTMPSQTVEARALKSGGISNDTILEMVCRALDRRKITGETLVDVGCGAGNLQHYVRDRFRRYIGVDALRYPGFPPATEFCQLNLDDGQIPLPDGIADVVASVEVIEHLENPRDFMRKLLRLARPGGSVVVTTPNQLSLLSLLTLITKQRFHAFQDVHYPAHLTALLPVDLKRIATECGLADIEFEYSQASRIPLTACSVPKTLCRCFPQALSESVLVIGTKAPAQ
jgi:2-polyprenyl-3-methyl-5-hydroxy-6-metoxy-1,4-benzoquinol methylase